MPCGLERFHQTKQSHFVTFSCYHRRQLFTTDATRTTFESALERVRRSFRLRVYAYVVMPEHIHLLLSEPEREMLADALKSLKQGVARRFDWKRRALLAKAFLRLQYSQSRAVREAPLHPLEPGQAGIVRASRRLAMEQLSTSRNWERGPIEIESEWTARKRERAAGALCAVVELPHSSQNTA